MKRYAPLQMPKSTLSVSSMCLRTYLASSTSVRLESTNDGSSVSDDGEEETGAVYAGSAKAVVPLQMLSSRHKELGGKSFLALQALSQTLKVVLL